MDVVQVGHVAQTGSSTGRRRSVAKTRGLFSSVATDEALL